MIWAAKRARQDRRRCSRWARGLYTPDRTPVLICVIVALVALCTVLAIKVASAEVKPEDVRVGMTLIVDVREGSVLNGRARPSVSSIKECRFYPGETLTATGETRKAWIEIVGGETGTVWVHGKYVNATEAQKSAR